jgi:hypothetical protein
VTFNSHYIFQTISNQPSPAVNSKPPNQQYFLQPEVKLRRERRLDLIFKARADHGSSLHPSPRLKALSLEFLSSVEESKRQFEIRNYLEVFFRPSADAFESLLDIFDRVCHAESQVTFTEIAKRRSRKRRHARVFE